MTNIVEVDFKNKQKVEEYVAWEYPCFICNMVYTYDSRYDLVRPKLINFNKTTKTGRVNYFYCEKCIKLMYDALKRDSGD